MPRPPLRSTLIDLCLAVAMAIFAASWWKHHPEYGLTFGVLTGLALMWRRRRPIAVFAVVALLSVAVLPIEAGGTRLHFGVPLAALAVAMYAAVRYGPSLAAGALVGVLTVLAGLGVLIHGELLTSPWHPFAIGKVPELLAIVLAYGLPVWSVAVLARVGAQRVQALRERAAAAERERHHLARLAVAEERARIARELHDIVAHSLSVMIVHANGAEYALDHDTARTRAALRTIGDTGRDALEEMKQLIEILRADDGDPAADRNPVALDQVGTVVDRARGAGLAVELHVRGTPPDVPGGVALAVYRIVQESLTNTLKHAGPAPVATVRLDYRADAIDVDITNTGDAPPRTPGGGHGLIGMRERVTVYGGAFDAGPHLGGGWRVRARIPLTRAVVA